MGDIKFSREHLLELTSNFNTNLKEIEGTLGSVKAEFDRICQKWQGGQSENAKNSIAKVKAAFDRIDADLINADKFINEKAEAFNNLRFNG